MGSIPEAQKNSLVIPTKGTVDTNTAQLAGHDPESKGDATGTAFDLVG